MTDHHRLPDVSSRYGAPMGRRGIPLAGPAPGTPKVSLCRVHLDRGGYDNGGAYWGAGAPLWHATDDDGQIDLWFRAPDRTGAKAAVRAQVPGARFYR